MGLVLCSFLWKNPNWKGPEPVRRLLFLASILLSCEHFQPVIYTGKIKDGDLPMC